MYQAYYLTLVNLPTGHRTNYIAEVETYRHPRGWGCPRDGIVAERTHKCRASVAAP